MTAAGQSRCRVVLLRVIFFFFLCIPFVSRPYKNYRSRTYRLWGVHHAGVVSVLECRTESRRYDGEHQSSVEALQQRKSGRPVTGAVEIAGAVVRGVGGRVDAFRRATPPEKAHGF